MNCYSGLIEPYRLHRSGASLATVWAAPQSTLRLDAKLLITAR